MSRLETDKELFLRIEQTYGQWGAFLSHASEARGKALDECAHYLGLKRKKVSL